MVNGTYKFRAVGPGLDFAEWGEADELDEILARLTLVVEKFKRDSARAETRFASVIDYDSLVAMYRQMGGA